MADAPVLKDFRTIRTITLPGYENSQVDLYEGLLFAQAHLFEDIQKRSDDIASVSKLIVALIKSWNFVDTESKPIPVSVEALEVLSLEAIQYLGEQATEILTSKKKATDAI